MSPALICSKKFSTLCSSFNGFQKCFRCCRVDDNCRKKKIGKEGKVKNFVNTSGCVNPNVRVLYKWNKCEENEDETAENIEVGSEGTYRSYRIDDISLSDQDVSVSELGSEQGRQQQYQELTKEDTARSTSSDVNMSEAKVKPRNQSLILNVSDLSQATDHTRQTDLEVTPCSTAKKVPDKKPDFFGYLMNFFSNLICRSRPNLTFDTNLTISTVEEMSCRTLETDLNSVVSGFNTSEDYRDNNLLMNCDFNKKNTNQLRRCNKPLRIFRSVSLPNIKFTAYETGNGLQECRHANSIAHLGEERVKAYKASSVCSALIIKSLEANGYLKKIEGNLKESDLAQIKITQVNNATLKDGRGNSHLSNKKAEKLCFLVQIPKKHSYFLNDKMVQEKDVCRPKSRSVFWVKENISKSIDPTSVVETQIIVEVRRQCCVSEEKGEHKITEFKK